MTRNGAIIMAHVVARAPLFRLVGDRLIRLSKEGALPLEFARWLRVVSLSASGVFGEGAYGYSIDRQNAMRIAQALPACIDGTLHGVSSRSTREILMDARRSGGRNRLLWLDGKMVSTN